MQIQILLSADSDPAQVIRLLNCLQPFFHQSAPQAQIAEPELAAPAPALSEKGPFTEPVLGIDLDAAGLPWDSRIHSASKDNRINADGTWRRKRNVSQDLVDKVERELRSLLAATIQNRLDDHVVDSEVAPPPLATAQLPETPAAPPSPSVAPPPAFSLPEGPPSPSVAPPPLAKTGSQMFSELVQFLSSNLTRRTVTHDQIQDEVRKLGPEFLDDGGKPVVAKLAIRTDLIEPFKLALTALGATDA